MLDETLLRPHLDDILASPEFKDSKRYRELLLYLAEECLAGRTPKEMTIGMRFFGKDAGFHSRDDASVRVYLANLRKKLDRYYATTTTPYTHKLRIPVGHYTVELAPVVDSTSTPVKKNRFRFPVFMGIALAGSFILGYYTEPLFLQPHRPVAPPNPIWNDFVKPGGRPTLIVFGDYFFVREKGGTGNYFRNSKINSSQDFRQAASNDPAIARKYEQIGFTFLRSSAPWGLSQLLPIFQNSHNGYSYKLASQFTTSDFKSSNVVFVGSFKTLYQLRSILQTFSLDYSIRPTSFQITDEERDSTYQFFPSRLQAGEYEKDYGLIAKGTGPDGSVLLMMMGNSETGVLQAVHTACDPNVDEAIAKKFSVNIAQDPLYFTLVINAEGMNEAIFRSDLFYFKLNRPLTTISDLDRKDSSVAR